MIIAPSNFKLSYIAQVLDEQQAVLLFKGCLDLDTMLDHSSQEL